MSESMNVIFNVSINERGLFELETADLTEENFQKLRMMLLKAKRIVIDTSSGYLGTSLCATIDDYEPPPIGDDENANEPTAYDYMTGLLVVIQDVRQKTNKLAEDCKKLVKNFESLKDAKSIDASALYTNLEGVVSDYGLADIHLGFAENRVNNLMERLLKMKLGGTES